MSLRPSQGELEAGVVAQMIQNVGILRVAGNRQHARPNDIGLSMDHSARIAAVSDKSASRFPRPSRFLACASKSTLPSDVSSSRSKAAVTFLRRTAGNVNGKNESKAPPRSCG